MTIAEKPIDEAKLTTFLGKAVSDWGAVGGTALALIGDKLGLYRAMAGAGPLTPAELAQRSGTLERYVREWLVNQAAATEYPGGGYDLVAFFDCLHDMGDPVAAARHAYRSLSPDGTVLIVEPMAGDHVEDNFNPVGRVYSAASVLVCTPNALASGPQALGTIAPAEQLREVIMAAGFTRLRRAAETPFNRIFEARP